MRNEHRHDRKTVGRRGRRVLGFTLPPLGERGQVIVEFVLVLPILLVLVVGIIEFASAWRTSQLITNVAREGARYSVVANGPNAGDEGEVQDSVQNWLNDAGLNGSAATITANLCSNCTGQQETITIEYPYEFIFFGPAINLMMGSGGGQYGTITLATTTSMRNE